MHGETVTVPAEEYYEQKAKVAKLEQETSEVAAELALARHELATQAAQLHVLRSQIAAPTKGEAPAECTSARRVVASSSAARGKDPASPDGASTKATPTRGGEAGPSQDTPATIGQVQVKEYKCADDETVRQIAASFGIAPKDLAAFNAERYPNLKANSRLYGDTQLLVPVSTTPSGSSSSSAAATSDASTSHGDSGHHGLPATIEENTTQGGEGGDVDGSA